MERAAISWVKAFVSLVTLSSEVALEVAVFYEEIVEWGSLQSALVIFSLATIAKAIAILARKFQVLFFMASASLVIFFLVAAVEASAIWVALLKAPVTFSEVAAIMATADLV